jgi:hypothetical protein
MKLHSTSLVHAVEQLDVLAPPPPPPPPPLEELSFGTIDVRHSGSQIEFSAHAVKTSICCGVALSQSA